MKFEEFKRARLFIEATETYNKWNKIYKTNVRTTPNV